MKKVQKRKNLEVEGLDYVQVVKAGGRKYYYFRNQSSGATTKLDGEPGTPAFKESYQKALRAFAPLRAMTAITRAAGAGRGSLAWVLEQYKEFMSPLLLKTPLQVALQGCDGKINAWFDGSAKITYCYELVAELERVVATAEQLPNIRREDALLGMRIRPLILRSRAKRGVSKDETMRDHP